MTKKYLDQEGLEKIWEIIKDQNNVVINRIENLEEKEIEIMEPISNEIINQICNFNYS